MSSFLIFLYLLNKLGKLGFRVLGKDLGVVVLDAVAFVQDHDLVTVDNCIYPVRDGENCGVFEGLLYELLDLLLGYDVDICSGLIQNYNLVAAEHSPADANELLFAGTEAATPILKFEVDSFSVALLFTSVKLRVFFSFLFWDTFQEVLKACFD